MYTFIVEAYEIHLHKQASRYVTFGWFTLCAYAAFELLLFSSGEVCVYREITDIAKCVSVTLDRPASLS